MKILITGSAGYVGNFLTEYFTQRGHLVVGCDLRMPDRQKGLANFTFRALDVTDAALMATIFANEQPDHVIHLAYVMDPKHDPSIEQRVDVDGSMNVLAAANDTASVKQLLLFSSTSAYGADPSNPEWLDESSPLRPNDYVYGINKKTVEEKYASAVLRSDLHLVIVRMCTAVGPSYYKPGGVVASFTHAPFALIVSGQNTRLQWLHEDDVKALVDLIIHDPEVTCTFNLAPDSYTTMRDLARAQKKSIISIPAWVLRSIFWLLWTLRITDISPPMVRLMTYSIVASPEKLKRRYNYSFAYSAFDAFQAAVDARRKNGTL